MSEGTKNSVEVLPDGTLTVSVDLTAPNAEIIALGLLEKAKDAAKIWIHQRKKIIGGAVSESVHKNKSLIDRILGGENHA